MPNVDSLNIQISAAAQKANSSLDILISKLNVLQSALGSVQTSQITGLANGVQQLGTAMQGMKNINAADFTRIAKGIQKFSELNPATINSAAGAMNRLGRSLGSVAGTNMAGGAAQIADIANAIKQLGYKSSTQAIDNIPKLAVAMRQLMVELSKAPTISKSVIDMTNALAKLARTGASSGRAAASLSKSMNIFSSSANKAKISSFSLASAIGKVYASYWLLFRAFRKVKEAIDISSQLTEVQNVVNTTFGSYRHLIEEFSNTSIVDFGMSELTAKKMSSTFQAMGTAMGFTQGKMAGMSVELTKLTADMASFYDLSQEDVAEDLQSVFTGQTRPLRRYGLDLTEATLKEWAMKNGLDANIKSMTQAEKTMLRYQYVMANTGAAQGDFARTINTWANQTRILKENFRELASVIGGTFINVLKPLVVALNQAMGAFISFAKTVSSSLGKIFGWQYEDGSGGIANDYEDAADSAGDIADSTGDAANNIKKMKAGLRAFDELKTISFGDKGDSGGGNKGGSNTNGAGADGGQWTKVDSIFKDYESSLDNLYKLGEYIGSTLTKSLSSIEWNKVYEGAKNFGKGLADFLNGLISPELFGAVGSTIAGALNTAIHASLSFAKNFDFKEFGLSIATGINNFFEDLDAGSLAKSISKWIKGGLEALKTVLKQTDFETIGAKVAEFVRNIDFSEIAKAFASVVAWAFDGGTKLLGSIIEGAPLESALIAVLGVLKFTSLGDNLALNIFNALNTAIAGAKDSASSIIGAIGTSVVGKIFLGIAIAFAAVKLLQWLKDNLPWAEWKENIASFFKEIVVGGVEKVKDISTAFTKKIDEAWTAVKTWWKNVGSIAISVSVANLKEKVREKWNEAKTWWDDKKGSLKKISTSVENLKTKLKEAWGKAKKWWDNNVKLKIPKLNFKVTYKKPDGIIQEAVVKALNLKGWPSMQFFASGGFPEDGTFRASHGEIMGRFDNGRTVVANNKQITDGISAAVYQGNKESSALLRQEIQLLQAQNELLSRILEKDTGISASALFETVRSSAKEYKRTTGNYAFV